VRVELLHRIPNIRDQREVSAFTANNIEGKINMVVKGLRELETPTLLFFGVEKTIEIANAYKILEAIFSSNHGKKLSLYGIYNLLFSNHYLYLLEMPGGKTYPTELRTKLMTEVVRDSVLSLLEKCKEKETETKITDIINKLKVKPATKPTVFIDSRVENDDDNGSSAMDMSETTPTIVSTPKINVTPIIPTKVSTPRTTPTKKSTPTTTTKKSTPTTTTTVKPPSGPIRTDNIIPVGYTREKVEEFTKKVTDMEENERMTKEKLEKVREGFWTEYKDEKRKTLSKMIDAHSTVGNFIKNQLEVFIQTLQSRSFISGGHVVNLFDFGGDFAKELFKNKESGENILLINSLDVLILGNFMLIM
jgi:hypothetical protein